MEIESKLKSYKELIEKNNNKLEPFYNCSFIVFNELNALKNEILDCLLLEFFQASIFTTNHLLERMVKLILIKNHTREHNYSEIHKYRKKLNESEKKYDGLTLNDSLNKAFGLGLISPEQNEYIKYAKNHFRNPFSHAQVSKINKDDDDFSGYLFDVKNVKESLQQLNELTIPKRIDIPKFSPAISQLLQEKNSKEIAFEYFRNIFNILSDVENDFFKTKRVD